MSIGLALFLIAIIWFAVVSPGFRVTLLVLAALVAVFCVVQWQRNPPHSIFYHETADRPASYEATAKPDITKLSDDELVRLYHESHRTAADLGPDEFLGVSGTCPFTQYPTITSDRLHCRPMKLGKT
jgi:hypothetical protein